MPIIEHHLSAGVAYADVSVHALVTEGRLSRSTFYSYFTDKTDLLRACAEAVFTQTMSMAGDWFELGPDITYDRMRAALASAVRAYITHAPLMSAAYDGAIRDASLDEAVTQIMDGLTERFAAHIREGQAGGWVDPTLLPRETAAWIVWGFERTQHQATLGRDADELTQLIDEGTSVVWRALYAPAVEARAATS